MTDTCTVCLECGKRITNGNWAVNYDNADGEVIPPESCPDHGQFGLQPIGPDCRRKMIANGTPRNWFVKWN